jgi:hypothetical protein
VTPKKRQMKCPQMRIDRYGHLVEGTKTLLQSFRSSQVVHVKRDANSAAHCIAEEAVNHVIDIVSVEEILPIIYDIISRELLVPYL